MLLQSHKLEKWLECLVRRGQLGAPHPNVTVLEMFLPKKEQCRTKQLVMIRAQMGGILSFLRAQGSGTFPDFLLNQVRLCLWIYCLLFKSIGHVLY